MKSVIGSEAGMQAIMAGENVFISGPAGAGKSRMIHTLRDFFADEFLFAAPTGVAALNIGGMSCHKAFGLEMGIASKEHFKAKSKGAAILLASEAVTGIVLDEISMIRSDKLYEMDIKLRYYRKNNKPFGGLQVICFGDGFQIKPVLTRNEMSDFRERYGDETPFDSETWKALDFTSCYLTKVYRQTDPVFSEHLNNIRTGVKIWEAVKYLNDNCSNKGLLENAVTLATTNKAADDINMIEYNKLEGREMKYRAIVMGEFKERPVAEDLKLKPGTKVMLCVNESGVEDGKDPRYVNGTVGIVEDVRSDYVVVNIDGNKIPIGRHEWQNIVQEPKKVLVDKEIEVTDDQGNVKIIKKKVEEIKLVDKVAGTYSQLPLKMSWALTTHKVQGLTIPRVNIDFGKGTFAAGQAYVALSRATSTEGLRLVRPLRVRDIIIDQKIKNFYKRTFPTVFKD